MAAFIPEHKIDEVRNAADIVEIVSEYVSLTRAGRGFKGLCPFHAEKSPSFTVNPERRIYHCYGCGAGGNVFRFLMAHKGLSFPEAVSELAQRYGIDLPRETGERPKIDRRAKTGLYQTTALAARFFQEELNSESGAEAGRYLRERGLSGEIVSSFQIGWAPPGWDNLLRFLESKGVPLEVMEKAGLIKPRRSGRGFYDTFRARIITPIFDLDGKVVAFGGRVLAEEEGVPKYINSPETPIYRKGRLLYGFERNRRAIREAGRVLLVEGYFDLISLAAHGVNNVVATLGTALTPDHLRLLKGYVQDVVLVFDADEAGRAAAARALPLFIEAELEGRVLALPERHDPDTFVREFGPAALASELDRAGGLMDFFLDQTLAGRLEKFSGRSRAAREVLSIIERVDSPAKREMLVRALSERLDISEKALLLSLRKPRKDNKHRPEAVGQVTAGFETELLRLVLLHPETAPDVFEAELGTHFLDPRAGKLYEMMALLFERTGRLDQDRLVEMLEEEECGLMTALALSEDGLEGEELYAAVDDYVRKFFERDWKTRSTRLSRLIKEAQASGDDSRLEFLLHEKNKMIKAKNF